MQLADSSLPLPGPPPPSQKPRPPDGWRLGVASGNCDCSLAPRKAQAPVGPPPASLACPLPAICQPGRLLANLKGTWGGLGSGLLLRALFSGRLGRSSAGSSLLRPGRCVKAVASRVPPQSLQPASPGAARAVRTSLLFPVFSPLVVHPQAPLRKGPVRNPLTPAPQKSPGRPVFQGWRVLQGGQARFRAREMPSSVSQTRNPRPSSLHVLDKPNSGVI